MIWSCAIIVAEMDAKSSVSVEATLDRGYASSDTCPKIWGMVTINDESGMLSPVFKSNIYIIWDVRTLQGTDLAKKVLYEIVSGSAEYNNFKFISFKVPGLPGTPSKPGDGVFFVVNGTGEDKKKFMNDIGELTFNNRPFPKLDDYLGCASRWIAEDLSVRPEDIRSNVVICISTNAEEPQGDARRKQKFNTIRQLPVMSCDFHMIGLGQDADSLYLYKISSYYNGVYHHTSSIIDSHEVGSAIADRINNTSALDLKLDIECNKGTRLMSIGTPFAISEHIKLKNFSVKLGCVSRAEKKNILLMFSLNKLDTPHTIQPMAKIRLAYTTPSGERKESAAAFSIIRMSSINIAILPSSSFSIDYRLGRYKFLEMLLCSIEELPNTNKSNEWLDRAMRDMDQKVKDADETLEAIIKMCHPDVSKRKHAGLCLISCYKTERFVDSKKRMYVSPESHLQYSHYVDIDD